MWLSLLACAPGAFSEEGAIAVNGAVTSVNADLHALIWSRTQPVDLDDTSGGDDTAAAAKGMSWDTGAEAGTFDGTVEGPGSWTGVVTLAGTYGLAAGGEFAPTFGWDMTVGYAEIGFGDLAFDGDVAWVIEVSSEPSVLTQTSTLVGDLTARGSVRGAGSIDTTTRVTLSGGRYVVEVVGTVGGHDVSDAYDATAFGL